MDIRKYANIRKSNILDKDEYIRSQERDIEGYDMKKKPIVKVEWWDAASYDDLYDLDHAFQCSLVVSVGVLFSRTKERIVLVRDDYTEDDGSHKVSGVLVIPRGWVKSIVVLEVQ